MNILSQFQLLSNKGVCRTAPATLGLLGKPKKGLSVGHGPKVGISLIYGKRAEYSYAYMNIYLHFLGLLLLYEYFYSY